MDDFSDDDFDSLPIKPRGAAVSPRAPVKPSPNKQTSPNVSSSSLPLMSEGKNTSKEDSDLEITFNMNKNVEETENDIFIPKGGPDVNNYKLNFDDLDFEKDGTIGNDITNDASLSQNNNSFGFGSLSLNGKSNNETFNKAPNDVIVPELEEKETVKRRGVTFQMNETLNNTVFKSNEEFTTEDPSGPNGGDEFGSVSTNEFMDNLDFLEQCGESDAEKKERQAALARQSLYQRFDPLVKDGTPVKPDRQRSAGLAALKERADQVLQRKNPLSDIAETSNVASPRNNSAVSQRTPDKSVSQPVSAETPNKKANSPKATGVDLVEPLLYTEKDVLAREAKLKKQIQQLEALRNEEIAMRELVEQDAREKQDSLRSENEALRKGIEEYEKTIIQLSESTQEDTMLKQERVTELLKEKEQLQNELNALDNSMYEYYQRMGKMKNTIDVLKKNEVSLKNALAECEKKLKDSEDRYRQLRKQAEDEVERANIEIEKVKKSKEVDLAGLRASLKQLQAKHATIEIALRQKDDENKELTKICEDLINRVTPGS